MSEQETHSKTLRITVDQYKRILFSYTKAADEGEGECMRIVSISGESIKGLMVDDRIQEIKYDADYEPGNESDDGEEPEGSGEITLLIKRMTAPSLPPECLKHIAWTKETHSDGEEKDTEEGLASGPKGRIKAMDPSEDDAEGSEARMSNIKKPRHDSDPLADPDVSVSIRPCESTAEEPESDPVMPVAPVADM